MQLHDSRRLARALRIAALLVVAGCNDSGTTPAPSSTVTIAAVTAAVYVGDVITMRATVRNAAGDELPGAAVTWTVTDPTAAELAPNGIITFLKPGAVRVTAAYGNAKATYDLSVAPLSVLQVTVLPSLLALDRGDVSLVGVRVQGQGGRDVPGRVVTITSDDPAVATIDASGRVRAVGAGATNIRATAGNVSGVARVEVADRDATLNLARLGGGALPLLVASDSVWYDGVRELHEVYVEGGTLVLSGAPQPRYEVDIRYVEYNVVTVDGRRSMQLRLQTREYDRGVVAYDARGDLTMTSEYISPLAHTAGAVAGGIQVRFRVPGDDQILDLFYRREPR